MEYIEVHTYEENGTLTLVILIQITDDGITRTEEEVTQIYKESLHRVLDDMRTTSSV